MIKINLLEDIRERERIHIEAQKIDDAYEKYRCGATGWGQKQAGEPEKKVHPDDEDGIKKWLRGF